MSQIFVIIEQFQYELLLFSAFWFLVGAIDELCMDLLWFGYRVRSWVRGKTSSQSDSLSRGTSDLLAVFVPVWSEAAVIGTMLSNCLDKWKNSDCPYRIYVGCYPNDPMTVACIAAVANCAPQIRPVILTHIGPTTKADCLNQIWKAMMEDEDNGDFRTRAVILHDAEDAVHADELDIYDRFIRENAAIQLPVIPVPVAGSRWISGHYCDEFAESHGKNMVVRQALGAHLPLAGVGCAVDRTLLGEIAARAGGRPFDESSLTEDYELGLRIGAAGGRTIMVRMVGSDGHLIGTRSCFPATLSASVRQKTRWLTGIALAGWDRLGWRGNLAQKWMLLHDRRSIFAAFVMFVAYAGILASGLTALSGFALLHQPEPVPPILKELLLANSLLLFWRLGVRAAFVASIYGPTEALMSIPRSLISNFISILSARRACFTYLHHIFGAPLSWDKTDHLVVPARSHGQN